jgi:hypothetical protein
MEPSGCRASHDAPDPTDADWNRLLNLTGLLCVLSCLLITLLLLRCVTAFTVPPSIPETGWLCQGDVTPPRQQKTAVTMDAGAASTHPRCALQVWFWLLPSSDVR